MNRENIEEILKNIGDEDVPADVRKIAEDVSTDFSKTLAQPKQPEHIILGDYFMKSRLTKLAVAAAIFIAFGIGFFTGQWSKLPRQAPYSLDVTGYTSVVLAYPTARKSEDSFWRQKALAAMQPRPYAQTSTTKTNLLNAFKQYLKEKHYD